MNQGKSEDCLMVRSKFFGVPMKMYLSTGRSSFVKMVHGFVNLRQFSQTVSAVFDGAISQTVILPPEQPALRFSRFEIFRRKWRFIGKLVIFSKPKTVHLVQFMLCRTQFEITKSNFLEATTEVRGKIQMDDRLDLCERTSEAKDVSCNLKKLPNFGPLKLTEVSVI